MTKFGSTYPVKINFLAAGIDRKRVAQVGAIFLCLFSCTQVELTVKDVTSIRKMQAKGRANKTPEFFETLEGFYDPSFNDDGAIACDIFDQVDGCGKPPLPEDDELIRAIGPIPQPPKHIIFTGEFIGCIKELHFFQKLGFNLFHVPKKCSS